MELADGVDVVAWGRAGGRNCLHRVTDRVLKNLLPKVLSPPNPFYSRQPLYE